MADEHISLHIQGMTCAACSSRIERELSKMDHVEASVNLATETARVTYDADEVSPVELVHKVKTVGYADVEDREEFSLYGMTCAACSNRIEKLVNKQAGVGQATVNLTNETATVAFYPDLINEKQLIEQIEKIGYEASVRKGHEEQDTYKEQELKQMRFKLIIAAIISVPL